MSASWNRGCGAAAKIFLGWAIQDGRRRVRRHAARCHAVRHHAVQDHAVRDDAARYGAGQGRAFVCLLFVLAPTLFAGLPNTIWAAESEDRAEAIQLADDGNGVRRLLYVRPFTLEEPYPYLYTKEQPAITAGYILVLEVDPQLAQPRQTEMPVLFVGARPAELANAGNESGRVIVLVPGDTDLTDSPLFYGSTELPERIDEARAIRERDLARQRGIEPRPAAEIEAAFGAGGEPLAARSIDGVYRALADLILEYSPQESGLAEIYRLIPVRP